MLAVAAPRALYKSYHAREHMLILTNVSATAFYASARPTTENLRGQKDVKGRQGALQSTRQGDHHPRLQTIGLQAQEAYAHGATCKLDTIMTYVRYYRSVTVMKSDTVHKL